MIMMDNHYTLTAIAKMFNCFTWFEMNTSVFAKNFAKLCFEESRENGNKDARFCCSQLSSVQYIKCYHHNLGIHRYR